MSSKWAKLRYRRKSVVPSRRKNADWPFPIVANNFAVEVNQNGDVLSAGKGPASRRLAYFNRAGVELFLLGSSWLVRAWYP